MNIKINAVLSIIVAIIVAIVASLIISNFSSSVLLLSGTIIIIVVAELAMLYFTRRNVLYRKQNIFAIISIAMLAITVIVGILDITSAENVLPQWCSLLGAVLIFSGNFVLITALIAEPRHALEEYGEKQNNENEFNKYGPYDTVRHPNNLGALLIALSLPLSLRSGWAFIPAVIAVIFIIIHAVMIENHRFENYKWYYDYTKKVPYMILPIIW